MGDDHGALPGPDLLGQPVPGADGLLLEPAPGQLHQVERGEEVRVEAVRGVEHALLGEALAVLEEQVLDEGGAGLGGADVDEDLAGPIGSGLGSLTAHAPSGGVPARCAGRRRGRGRARPRDADAVGRPSNAGRAGPGRRAQRSRRRAGPRRAARPAPAPSPGTARAPSAAPGRQSRAGQPADQPPQHGLAPGDVRPDPEHRVDPAEHVDRLGAEVPPARDQGPGVGRRAGDRPTPRIPAAVRATGSGSRGRRPRAPSRGRPGRAHCRARVGRSAAGGRSRRARPARAKPCQRTGAPRCTRADQTCARDSSSGPRPAAPGVSGRPRRGPRRRVPVVPARAVTGAPVSHEGRGPRRRAATGAARSVPARWPRRRRRAAGR